MSVSFNGINTWISAKPKKEAEKPENSNSKEVPNEGKYYKRVGADLAMATLGVNKRFPAAKNAKLHLNADNMLSRSMRAGDKGNLTSIFYINDVHGRLSNMERITTASLDFDKTMPTFMDKLKFSAGDIMLGPNVNTNKAANSFLNANNFMASVVGNHEVDQNMSDFLTSTQDALYKVMGSNVEMDKSHKLYNRIINSYVQEDSNNNKYGIVALMPFDLQLRSTNKELFDGLKIEQMEQTKQYLQDEVNRFSEEGINRVIVLSHIGYQNDLEIAKSVDGIDIILGGHSHDLVEDLGENLIIKKENGAPTIVTQAGRDGNYYGILNVEFDDDGEIVKAENIVKSTSSLERNKNIQDKFNEILGTPKVVGSISSAAPMPTNNLKEENPHGSILAEAMKDKYHTDFAMVQGSAVRGIFTQGEISSRDIEEIFPFKDKFVVADVTEKELVETFKYSATSLASGDGKPGLLQVAGMRYSVGTNGELVSMSMVDKNGNEKLINVNDPSDDKTYSVVIPDTLAKGLDGYTMMSHKLDEPTSKLVDDSFSNVITEYIQNNDGDINIQKDGRIKIV